jgi:hypothetical protein
MINCFQTLLSNFAFKLNLRRFTAEEAAAQAYKSYTKDGVAPLKFTSQFKGVYWHKGKGKWLAKWKGTWLGTHATEKAAAQAYKSYTKAGAHTRPLLGST